MHAGGGSETMGKKRQQLKHVKAYGSYPVQTTGKIETVFDLKQLCFYPREGQKLTTNKISFRCLYGGHMTCDVTGLLKMNSKMGQG